MRTVSKLLAVLLVGAAASFAEGAYVCSPGPFLLPTTYGAGQLTGPVATADFNGDNHTDVVVATETGFSLLLGNGDGSFQLPLHVDSNQSFSSIAAGDLDGNGLLGVIAGAYDSIAVYVSNGDATFQAPVTISRSSYGPIALGDFNGDQRIDIVSATNFPLLLSVYLGNGDGTFQSAISTDLPFDASALAVADFDGDHNDDVAVATSSGCCPGIGFVDVFIGDGAGGFAQPLDYAAGGGVRSLVAIDVDTDHHVDLAMSVGGFVSILLNAGDGTFDAPIEYEAPNSSGDVVAGDFDDDGVPDLAALAASTFNGDVGFNVLFGNGDGTFLPSKFYRLLGPLGSAASADFNEDGRSDLAIVAEPDHLAVANGTEGRDFEAEREFFGSVFAGFNPPPPSYADFDRDGATDLLASDGTDAFLISGDGNRGFHPPVNLHIAASRVAVGDFNGDGSPDFLALPFDGQPECDILVNDGSGSFSIAGTLELPFGVDILATGDFNGDGSLDFLAAGNFMNSAEIFLGDGHGAFVDAGASTLDSSPISILAADLNGDGLSDLILIESGIVEVRLSAGNGTFQSPSFAAALSPSDTAIGDVNGDGKLDLVFASNTTYLTVYPGNGNGSFQSPTIVGLAYPASGVAASDFNGDGKTDLATADESGPGVSVLIAKGGLKFFAPAEFAGAGTQLLAVDLTGGHHPDLVSFGASGIAVIRNSHVTVSAPATTIVACTNSTTHIVSHAAGRGPLSYQWRKDTVPLSDGGAILGSQSDTLTIQNPSPGDSGNYDVVVTDVCGTDTSDPTAVTVEAPPATPLITVPATVPPSTSGLTAFVPFSSGDTYFWTNLPGNIDSGQGTSQISFTSPGPGLQMSFTVVDTSAGGCQSDAGTATIQVDFLDVPPSNPFHDFIDAIALHGVTVGCGNGDYCPNNTLRRDEMAAFIARAAVGTPPDTGTIGAFSYDCVNGPSYFSDVAVGSTFCSHIHYLASQGITIGCSPQHFCPSLLVTREQMALFIGRAIAPAATPPSAYSDGTTGRSYDCSVASPFLDVPANTESCNAVGYIWAKGIVDGFGDGTFHPDDALTRAPAAKFIANAFHLTLGP